ncbi:Uncharacterised protein [Megamonas hypermegale]|jgi:hypothetical protein|uniref:Uncharacterized protein n=1 Tax=Megamonas hypermegale TaxID=158847 RepID=A0A239TF38_9FIRM|nr:Uncharacterised protein [Megamonas hypermegale]
MNKKLLTSDELIKHMKQKGITFNVVDEKKLKISYKSIIIISN